MELGRTQKLEIVRMVDFGAYLGTEEEQVLLPKKQVPEGANVGDEVKVFIYRDSQDRQTYSNSKQAFSWIRRNSSFDS